MAYVNTDSSFRSMDRIRRGSRAYVRAWSYSAVAADTPGMVQLGTSGLTFEAIADSVAGSITCYGAIIGVARDGAMASSASAWVQIEGPRDDVQFDAALCSGDTGHAGEWSVGVIFANGSSYYGGQTQWGTLLEDSKTASTTCNVFLTGKLSAGSS